MSGRGALHMLVLKGRRRRPDSSDPAEPANRDSYAEGVEKLFRTIAFVSENRELRLVRVNMIECSQIFCSAETRVSNPGGATHSLRWRKSIGSTDGPLDRKSTRLNSSHSCASRLTSSA